MESAIAPTTSKYVRDFESLFVPIKVDQLRDKARNGNLRHCQFRSLCWRYFLHCLPEKYDQWLESCVKSRQQYEVIRARHSQSKQLEDEQSSSNQSSNNKQLSERGESSARQLAKSKEFEEEQQYIRAANQCDHKNVFRTIERDVVRTFPDMEFFRQSDMQGILENVLFNFASEHPHLSYKQGMHELLATLLYVLHTDSQNCLINYQGGYANETVANLLDLKYLEHDVFHLFCALMKSIETWYQNDEILMVPDIPDKTGNGGVVNRSSRQQFSSVLGIKLKMISENIVKNFDSELFNHLEALQIAPQIYGIRWMRLLFGREFEFLDLLTVWDAIICDIVSMSLTDYIFASMLLTIREELVNGDYTDCLNNLMRHQFKDVQYVIQLALHLRDPKNNPRPKPLQPSSRKHYSQTTKHNRYLPETSLTNKLSQQYLNTEQQIRQVQRPNNRNQYIFPPSTDKFTSSNFAESTRRSPKTSTSLNVDNRDSRKIFSMTTKNQQQQQQQPLIHRPVKEYEMREMQSSSSSSTQRGHIARNLGFNSGESKNSFNQSTESYDDLHSIVDYCWRLLSEQIDSLQRCLPKEKSLHSEDEIFVALAQLKKVRDVLKGSLRLEDELELPPGGSKS